MHIKASLQRDKVKTWLYAHRLYVGTIVLSLVLTALWCLSVPDVYKSQIKVSDEAKEMDLNIGLDFVTVTTRDLNPSAGNESQNNASVYSRIITSGNFADSLSHITLASRKCTFAEYVLRNRETSIWEKISLWIDKAADEYDDEQYVCSVVQDCIKYNFHSKYNTLTLQYEDPDAVVAAEMVEHAAELLQRRIDNYRCTIQLARMEDDKKACDSAKIEYERIQARYSNYADSHQESVLQDEVAQLSSLEKETDEARERYEKANEKYTRTYALSKKYVNSFAVLRNATVALSPSSPVPFPIFLAFASILFTIAWCYRNTAKVIGQETFNIEWGGVFAPWSIMILHWVAILILFSIESDLLEPLSDQFYFSLLLWVSIFVSCSFIIYQLLPRTNLQIDLRNLPVKTIVFNIFFWLSVIITPLHLYQIMKLVMMFDPSDMLSNIRIVAVAEAGDAGFLNYSYVINQVLLVVAMCRFPNIKKWKLAVIVLCTLISAFAVMEKGILLYLVVVVLFSCYEKKYIRVHTIVTIFAIIIGVFFFLTLVRFSDNNTEGQELTFLDFFAIYILSGPVAFGRLMEDLTMQFGANTFQTAYLFLNRMFLGQYEVHQALQEFVWIPLPTNVYTVMQPFFIDFGYAGVAFFAFVYGAASAVFYRMYRNGSSFGFCMYAYTAEVLMIQFHQDEIFFGMVHFIQFTFFVWLFTNDSISIKFRK